MRRSPFITDWVFDHAAVRPDAPAVDSPQHRVTYGELARRVRDLAGDLAARGVGPRDRVVVALPSSAASVVAALAVQALGGCAVEIDRGLGHNGFAPVLAQARPHHALVAAQDGREWALAQGDGRFAWAWVLGGAPGGPAPRAGGSPRDAEISPRTRPRSSSTPPVPPARRAA